MKEFIQYINQSLEGSVVLLGGWAKHYHGIAPEYDKHWVDISITPEEVEKLSSLGTKLILEGGHSWSTHIIDQFLVRFGDKPNRKYLDVFVREDHPTHTIIDGIKVQTPEACIKWHEEAYDLLKTDYLLTKIQRYKEAYSL